MQTRCLFHFIGKKMIKLFITGISCALSVFVYAQQKYSLEEIWDKTLQQYPSLTANKELIKGQSLKKNLVKQQFLPEINVQAQQSYGSFQNLPGSFFPLAGMYTINGNSKTGSVSVEGSSLYSSAVLQWNVIQFGRLEKKLEVADAAIQLSTESLKQEEWRLLSVATRSYFSVLNNIASLQIATTDVKRLSDLFGLLQSQSNAGLRPGADTLLIKSALLQSKSKIHEHQAALQSSLLQLSSLVGEQLSVNDLDTSIYYRFNQNAIDGGKQFQDHPYLRLMNARINYGEAEQQVIKKEVYPSIGLLAGAGIKGSGLNNDGTTSKSWNAPWTNAGGTYLAGVGLIWNFSSLYQNKTKRTIAEHEIASLKAQRDAVKIQLETQYASTIASWKQQQQKLAEAEIALSSSRQAYELYEVRYQSGLISLIELLQLQKNLQDAESYYATALSSYWNELINQSETLGNPSLLLTAIQR